MDDTTPQQPPPSGETPPDAAPPGPTDSAAPEPVDASPFPEPPMDEIHASDTPPVRPRILRDDWGQKGD